MHFNIYKLNFVSIWKGTKKSKNDTWQLLFTLVNYFNGVSEKDQIEKKLPILGSN